jgi:hypothetical protein
LQPLWFQWAVSMNRKDYLLSLTKAPLKLLPLPLMRRKVLLAWKISPGVVELTGWITQWIILHVVQVNRIECEVQDFARLYSEYLARSTITHASI